MNNAGIRPTVGLDDLTEALFDEVISANLRSVVFLSRHEWQSHGQHGYCERRPNVVARRLLMRAFDCVAFEIVMSWTIIESVLLFS